MGRLRLSLALLAACGVTEDTYAPQVADGWCPRLASCAPDRLAEVYGDEEGCRAAVWEAIDDARELYRASGCVFDERRATGCLDDTQAAGCDAFVDDALLQQCREVWDCT